MHILSSILAASLLTVAAVRGQVVQTIYSFPNDGSQGEYPAGTMALGPGGLLYGTTVEGGINDKGTAFKITTEGAFTSLGSFDPATTGTRPYSRLINGGDGFLYGVTERNTGTSGDPNGTLFKLDPENGLSVVFQLPGFGITPKFPRALLAVEPGAIRVLGSDGSAGFWKVPLNGSAATSFNLAANIVGAFAYSATLGSNGLIYGTTTGVSFVGTDPTLRGTIFRVSPEGTDLVRLHDCQQATGTTPTGAMVQATDGNFYGTMVAGGSSGKGVIFRLSPEGDYTVIHHFTSLSTPLGDLMQATDGFLYGTAQFGGATNLGGVFRISLNGAYTLLHNFNGNNGTRPQSGLVQANDGNLYGTVSEGGAGGKGTIYRVKLSLPPPNRAPVALDDIGVTSVNPVTINVLGNDFDSEGGALTVTEVSVPGAGTATILGDNTIQYDPGIGFSGSDTFTYTVSDPAGLTATATVTIQTEPAQAAVYSGVFNGLLNLDPEFTGNSDSPRAQIVVAIGSTGRFSGFMLTQRARVPFRGVFNLTDGIAAARVNIPGKGKAVLFLGFRPDEEATLLAVVFGREVWAGGARPVIPSGLAATDNHTVALVSQGAALPDGFGFGVMQIRANGLVSCAGKYGDGTRLAWGTTLVSAPDGAPLIPVFSEPLPGGVCAGVFDSRADPANYDFAGSLRWIRPPGRKATLPYASGFTGYAAGGSSRYIPKPRGGTLDSAFNLVPDLVGLAFIAGGPLAAPIGGEFAFAPRRVVVTSPLKQLVFNQRNGLVTGRMMNGTKQVSFIGIVNQPGNFGAGQFQIGGVFGRFELNP
jgi:uncharacterized repeat protein (TIGR03803 family)